MALAAGTFALVVSWTRCFGAESTAGVRVQFPAVQEHPAGRGRERNERATVTEQRSGRG